MTRVDTIVVGAGVSGLAYAHARGADADLLVLDGADRAGGLVRTSRGGPGAAFRYEWGPEALQTGSQETNALLDESGIRAMTLGGKARKRFIARAGRLVEVPTSPPAFLRSELMSFSGKLRLLTEKWRDPRRALDGSIADFVRHRLGREALESLVDPLVSGILAGDPETLSLRAAFPELAGMVEEHGSLFAALGARRKSGARAPGLLKPEGGMEELPRALGRALGDRLRLGTRVESLRPDVDGFGVSTSTGELACRRLVLALPLRAAQRLLAGAAPVAAERLASMRCESFVVLVHAYRRERVADALDGFGYLVPGKERQRQLGTLFSSSIDPACAPADHALLRTMLGGARHPELVERSDEELHAIVAQEVAPLLGLAGAPEWSVVLRYPDTLPRYDIEHPRRRVALARSLPEGLDVLGNFCDGVGLTKLIPNARGLARQHAEGRVRESVSGA